MNCPYCKNNIPDNFLKFCPRCGHKLEHCPTCGLLLTKKIKFCPVDGTAVPDEIIADLPDRNQMADDTGSAAEVKKIKPVSGKSGSNENENGLKKAKTSDSKRKSKKSKNTNIVKIILITLLIVLLLLSLGIGVYIFAKDMLPFGDNSGQNIFETGEADRYAPNEEETKDKDAKDPDGTDETENRISTSNKKERETEAEDFSMETESETEERSTDSEDIFSGDYILKYSNIMYLSESDLEGFTAEMCRIARNEIYARHGRKFDDEQLQEYFSSKSWYSGIIAPADFKESMLNDYEIKNRDLIVAFEEKMGYR